MKVFELFENFFRKLYSTVERAVREKREGSVSHHLAEQLPAIRTGGTGWRGDVDPARTRLPDRQQHAMHRAPRVLRQPSHHAQQHRLLHLLHRQSLFRERNRLQQRAEARTPVGVRRSEGTSFLAISKGESRAAESRDRGSFSRVESN